MVLPGFRVRETHISTVRSIVGREKFNLTSRGEVFRTKAPFFWRFLAIEALGSPKNLKPRMLADRANMRARHQISNHQISIEIAECPDDVSRRLYSALIGGAAHEAYHVKYGRWREPLTPREVEVAIQPLIENPSIDWGKYKKLVLDLMNIFEDIAIERVGSQEFPGTYQRLVDLAEYVIRQEQEILGQKVSIPQAVFVLLRDLGLGYRTPLILDYLDRIRKSCPEGAAMVAPGGLLWDIHLRSIPKVDTPKDIEQAKASILDGSILSLALRAVVILVSESTKNIPPIKESSERTKESSERTKESSEESSEGTEDSSGDSSEDSSEGTEDSSEGTEDSSEGTEDSSEGTEDSSEGTEDSSEGTEDSSEGTEDSSEGTGDSSEGTGDSSEDSSEGTGDSEDSSDGDPSPSGASGVSVSDPSETAQDFLEQFEKDGSRILDSNKALEAGVRQEQKGREKSALKGEMAYKPFSTSNDRVEWISAEKTRQFSILEKRTRKSISYLRTRLGFMFRSLENSGVEHGVRKGPRVSDRMLVDTYCEIRSGYQPTRAYMDRSEEIDTSIAAALVIDESASMSDKIEETCAGAYALMSSLDSIGAKTMAVGFRSGGGYFGSTWDADSNIGQQQYHRFESIIYDMFKSWDDPWAKTSQNMLGISALGGTPMADGIEFALRNISTRHEGFRIVFVLTDGTPNQPHDRVIQGQIRRAQEAGILLVGVGLGYGSEFVENLFPDSVFVRDLDDLPKALVEKLEELIRTRMVLGKRGKQIKKQ